ncbi:unnamed protein product [Rhizoctonia solani]|uniref:Transmembrane protein n=1 Tax=Rhizoctonia solani TaxID=456999 RepID=A0A8H2WR39_9AGAM|nr:unnamed protein product [Rhizoctonia solani]CAE6509080.1 unnamed protein product [Rhizoctonia solani]
MSLAAVSATLDWLRTPPFEIWGVSFPLMDIIGAFRLSIILRFIKKLKGGGADGIDSKVSPWISALILFGGEAIMCSQLQLTPSFLLYPNITFLFMGAQFLINEIMREPPSLRFWVELPLSAFDAFGRGLLLCDFAPGLIAKHPDPAVANSPLALLITSEVLTNGGFFFVNLLNMLDPSGWKVEGAPPELLPWGWTAIDLWTAPVLTALWASLTHWRNQPFWADMHSKYLNLGDYGKVNEKPIVLEAWTHEDARALCIVILIALFVFRTWRLAGPRPKFWKTKTSRPSSLSPSEKPASLTTSIELNDVPSTPTSIRRRRNKQSRGKSLAQAG